MKKFLTICMAALSLCACQHDEYEVVDLDSYSLRKLDHPSYGTFKVTSESESDMEQKLESTKASSTSVNLIAGGLLSALTYKKVHEVVGTYTSVDLDGNPVTISGKIFYPKNGHIRNIILASHWTIGSNQECPSETFALEGLFAAEGYVVVEADYLGYGVTRDRVHPYLQAETTACNVIDMLIAAEPFIIERGIAPDSDKLILVGYSQGGATTMHVQYHIENDPQYEGLFKVKKNYAGSGPYDIAKTYDYCVKKDITGIPCAIPMIIQGMSIGMAVPLDMSYFFREPLLSNYKDWINSKKYSVAQISALIGSNKLSEILTENAIDKTKSETARFYRELQENSIPKLFVPQAPVFMFHSEDDETVPFINSQILQRQFSGCSSIDYDFGHYGSHQSGAVKFILKVAQMLK